MVQTAACKYKMFMNLRSKSPVHSDNVKESKKNIQLKETANHIRTGGASINRTLM